MKTVAVVLAFVAAAAAVGPTKPHVAVDCGIEVEGYKVVDDKNICWYWECVNGKEIARVCALGSRISYNFVEGVTNPCTFNFDSTTGYDCERTRPSVPGPPPCYTDNPTDCQNGGTWTYESDKCWCECPPSWQGDYDCSKPTRDVTHLPAGSDICVEGEPMDDWCALAGGCLSNGECFNQCDTFWCQCPDRKNNEYTGKRCERGQGNKDH